MQLSRLVRPLLAVALGAALAAAGPTARAEGPPEGILDADFLFGYYDQDGDRSPVTGGVGTVTSTILASHVVEAAERAANQ